MAGCEDLGGPGAGPGLAGGAARPGRVKSPLVFLLPVLCSALLGDSSCGFHSAAPRPAQQHSAAAEDDDDDEDDDDKMTILMNMMMTIVMITKSENELSI